ncbi:glycoside hydrolase family 32 protein [Vreelandella nigrificans]|uniref:Glycosyl hydrolase family 32 n=1 Tax=Vreelandella nigrificans TaxID=2042704 RepID=A0A2A4HK37_9GAMM|nr:glycoside hydrolase family 32 protein [Halomonas nigrificans]PCF95738.1 glycosyl hydrolase family 32 [Halomonas nigrificans]
MTLANFVPQRPQLHMTPPMGWMNDPNGLVYFEGEYHLFYQYHPFDTVWGPMHWGHAVSKDLCRWQHLPIALAPDEQGACFSGSAVVDELDVTGLFGGKPGLLVFYTCHKVLSSDPEDYEQSQCVAYSCDRGRTWQRFAHNPILPPPGFKDFRDPKVLWHSATQRWVMALACGQEIHFYTSKNLLDWQFASAFGEGHGAHTQHPWECPDLFELPVEGARNGQVSSRWVLIVGIGATPDNAFGSFTQYFVGEFDGQCFINDHSPHDVMMMDEGRDFYAVQSWSNTPGRRLAVAWLNNWQYANHAPEAGWRGMMSLPRELTLRATSRGIQLCQRIASECHEALTAYPQTIVPQEWLGVGQHVLLASQQAIGRGVLTFTLMPGSRVALSLQQGDHQWLILEAGDEDVALRYTRQGVNGQAAFDNHFACDHAAGSIDGLTVTVEWWCDHGSLEILVNGDTQQRAITQVSFISQIKGSLDVKVLEGSARLLEGNVVSRKEAVAQEKNAVTSCTY